MDVELQLRRAAQVLGAADALLVTAGAGIGVDSGYRVMLGATRRGISAASCSNTIMTVFE